MSRFRQSLLNLNSSFLKSLITTVIGLISTPLLLKWLGEEIYGSTRVLIDLFFNLGILEFGLTGAMIPLFSALYGKNNSHEQDLLLHASKRSFYKLYPIVFFVLLLLFFFITKIVPVSGTLQHDLMWGYVFICLGFLYMPLIPYKIALQGNHRTDIVNWIMLFQLLLTTCLSLLAAYLALGIKGQTLAFACALITGHLLFKIYFHQKNCQRIDESRINYYCSELKKNNRSSFVLALSNRASFYFDNLLVGIFFSPAMVAPFLLTQKLAQLVQHQLGSFGNSIWSPLIEDYHKGNIETFKNRFLSANKIITIFSVAAIIPIILFNSAFLKIWVGEKHDLGLLVVVLASSIAFLQTIVGFWGWLLTGGNKIKEQVRPQIVASLVNLSLSLFFIKLIGISGPLWGSVISLSCVILPIWGREMMKLCGCTLVDLVSGFFLPILIGFIFVMLVRTRSESISIHLNFLELFIVMGSTSVFYLLICVVVLVSKSEKKWMYTRLKGLRS